MINKHQKQYLKGLANTLKPTVQIGKSGLTETVLDSIEDYLTAHEIVKIDVLKSADCDMDELVLDIAAETKSEIVSQLGRKIVYYRANIKDRKIILPK